MRSPDHRKLTPAQIRKSTTHDALISVEDGKPQKMLRRHPTIRGLTPEAYCEKWGLPRDHPMVTASYSEARSAIATSLGQQRRKAAPKAAATSDAAKEKPKQADRSRKAEKPAGA